jgi:hypothetical protein
MHDAQYKKIIKLCTTEAIFHLAPPYPSQIMSFGKVLQLNTGATIPEIGLGTWLSQPNEVENAVSHNLS